MSEKELEKCVVGYYLYLIKIDEKLKELVMSSERPLTSLKNQMEQLRLVSDDALDKAELCCGRELREKLIFKINVGIEDDIALLGEISSQLNNANQGLRNKFRKLEDARSKVDPNTPEMQELVIGTPHRPRLNLLMEWAIDSSSYYNKLYSSINGCLRNLDCRNDETLENLTKSFRQEKTERANIDRILGFIQFIAKET